MKQTDPDTRPTRPNILVRFVARIGISIRWKLLAGFLGLTALMAGLAVFGLSALQDSHKRTQTLVDDHQRAASYYEIYGFMGELIATAVAASSPLPDRERTGSLNMLESPGFVLMGQLTNYQRDLTQMRRRGWARTEEDQERLTRYIEALRTARSAVARLRQAREGGNWSEARDILISPLLPTFSEIQRDAYTVTQRIEAQMARTARQTETAFLASRWQVTAAALAAIGAALLVGYVISSSLLWPLRRIGSTLADVSGGDFETRAHVPNRDELGQLADDVNAMSAQLGTLYAEVEDQKAKLEDLNASLEQKVTAQVGEIERTNRLRRFLPPQIADMIVQGDNNAQLLDTRRGEITVLFADLRGFTAFSNVMPPGQVIGALNAFHSAIGPIIDEKGGTIERFLGDGIMVLFGAPVAMEDAAQRAVECGLEMQAALAESLAAVSQNPDGTPLGVGIGIGTGVATLGQIGFEGRQDYSAIGPAPNLAARLCEKAAAGQILISHATAWQIEADIRPTETFDFKGIGKDIAAFEVLGRAEGL